MSYCRFIEADVYVYASCDGPLVCCACSLSKTWEHYSTAAIVAHLKDHIDAGDYVPDHVIPALEADREENDQFIREHTR